jgi:hypothetical protein
VGTFEPRTLNGEYGMSYNEPDRKDVISGIALAVIMAFFLIIYVAAPV